MTKQHGNICSAWPGKAEGICTKCVRCVSCQNLEHSSHRREKLVGIALVCFEQMGTPANFRQKATPKPTPRVHEAQGAKVLAPAVALAFRQSQVVKKLRNRRKWQSLQCLQLRKFRSQRYLKIRKILWNSMKHDETTWYSYFHNLPLICPKTAPNVPSRALYWHWARIYPNRSLESARNIAGSTDVCDQCWTEVASVVVLQWFKFVSPDFHDLMMFETKQNQIYGLLICRAWNFYITKVQFLSYQGRQVKTLGFKKLVDGRHLHLAARHWPLEPWAKIAQDPAYVRPPRWKALYQLRYFVVCAEILHGDGSLITVS